MYLSRLKAVLCFIKRHFSKVCFILTIKTKATGAFRSILALVLIVKMKHVKHY